MSRSDSGSPAPSRTFPDAADVTVSDAVSGDVLDFEAERDDATTSWERADGLAALIERASTYGWLVTLPGGTDAHSVALADESGAFVGWCDCKGYEFNVGPCAHLCALRQAAYVHATTTDGERVRIASTEVEDTPEVRPDGGHHIERACREHATGGRRVGGEGSR
ncbi:SWIM zinc finger family protein [Halobaculum lipolyticum]|uniref:SWIM zinc finger family protein n=1 Tax=Halobaculum lipolyticum TaxID=3032001 RepID=A0ABD5W962_9EURY|nr:SWIM zinc finger family protein [Halobaculum sp. DT31]